MTDITLPKGLTIDLSNGDSNSMLITIPKSHLEQLTAGSDKYRFDDKYTYCDIEIFVAELRAEPYTEGE